MRDIRFRGKRTDNGEWVVGGGILRTYENNGTPKEEVYIIKSDSEFRRRTDEFGNIVEIGDAMFCAVNPDTVCECTGLTDKNNRMVFEGDVVLCDGMKSVVKFGDRNCGCCHDVYGFVFDTGTYLGGGCIAYDGDKCYFLSGEVIGNIYDNPDLIEQ